MENGNDDIDFVTYLDKECKLSESTRNLIRYTLSLGTNQSLTLKDGITQLNQHLSALGQYGKTAFLVPMYGCGGELSQFFCRSAAVYGATYLLRRSIYEIILHSEDNNGNGRDTKKHINEVVLDRGNSSNSIASSSSSTNPEKNNIDMEKCCTGNNNQIETKKKSIRATNIIIPKQALKRNTRRKCKKSVSRRVSILLGKLMLEGNLSKQGNFQINKEGCEQRSIIIIPPNHDKIHNRYPIHGIIVDESINVVPPYNTYNDVKRHIQCDRNHHDDYSCSILHLTTTIDHTTFSNNNNNMASINNDDNAEDACLQRAVDFILSCHNSERNHVDEIHYSSFSYDFDDKEEDIVNCAENENRTASNHNVVNNIDQMKMSNIGLHIISRPNHNSSLTYIDSAFIVAKNIFTRIVRDDQKSNSNTNADSKPSFDFLALSKEMNQLIQDQFGGSAKEDADKNDNNNMFYDDNDEEQFLLQRALDTANQKET